MASAKEPELQGLEQRLDTPVQGDSRTTVWLRPVIDAVARLGGEATPNEVERWLRKNYANMLRPQQWAHVIRTKHVRWACKELRKLGVFSGETGRWILTDLGRKYWEKHRGDLPEVPTDWPALSDEETGDIDGPPITVEATNATGYEIPLLRHLQRGVHNKRDLLERVLNDVRDKLLPGDLRIVPQGSTAFEQRAAWGLTYLSRKEEATNVGHGTWEITETGRRRLSREGSAWSLEAFRGSKTKVRGLMTPLSSTSPPKAGAELTIDAAKAPTPTLAQAPAPTPAQAPTPTPPQAPRSNESFSRPTWDMRRWAACKETIGAQVFAAVQDRIRPDLGPTPPIPLVRNIIFHGPPGTGKTRAGKLVAQALTGEEPGIGGHRLVQFHPSYSYEDFIQGLRPELGGSSLQYQVKAGPFVQICRAAAEDRKRFHVLVIDEINRGEPSRIFGEALYGLEYREGRVGLLGGGELIVPSNLVVIGTMNSVDRSVALMDYALRRRFGFVYLTPELARVRERWPGARHIDEIIVAVTQLNDWLRAHLSTEHVIGHSFFLNESHALDVPGSIHRVWDLDIAPLLEEYLFHDRERLQEIHGLWTQWTSRIGRAPHEAKNP